MNETASDPKIIDGKAFAAGLRARIGETVAGLKERHGLTPGLAVVLVGEDPASAANSTDMPLTVSNHISPSGVTASNNNAEVVANPIHMPQRRSATMPPTPSGTASCIRRARSRTSRIASPKDASTAGVSSVEPSSTTTISKPPGHSCPSTDPSASRTKAGRL